MQNEHYSNFVYFDRKSVEWNCGILKCNIELPIINHFCEKMGSLKFVNFKETEHANFNPVKWQLTVADGTKRRI